MPGDGRLVLGAWPERRLAGAALQQVLATGIVRDWQARWDETGTALALWVSDAAPVRRPPEPVRGRSRDRGRRFCRAAARAEPAFEGFSLRSGRLAWSAPAGGGDTTVEVLAWSGDTIGRVQLPTESGVTVIR